VPNSNFVAQLLQYQNQEKSGASNCGSLCIIYKYKYVYYIYML
jgi:hypothetical protein